MPVYVDDVRLRFGRMVMCHMWADTPAELHAMAARIGIQRRWFQTPPKASWDHYDISLSCKVKAIAAGAVLTDRFGPAEHAARLGIASGDPARMTRGEKLLATIAHCRALRAER